MNHFRWHNMGHISQEKVISVLFIPHFISCTTKSHIFLLLYRVFVSNTAFAEYADSLNRHKCSQNAQNYVYNYYSLSVLTLGIICLPLTFEITTSSHVSYIRLVIASLINLIALNSVVQTAY